MAVDINSEEGQVIRRLIPLSTISNSHFEALCKKFVIEETGSGNFLFKRNDDSNDLIFLIKGSVTLKSDQLTIETIESGSESSRFALAHQIPRKIDAYTNSAVRFLRVNMDMINSIPEDNNEEPDSSLIVDEIEDDDDDWMTTLLKSPIFKALPPSNLQQIIMSLEEVHFKKGEMIIKQGDEGDCYYLIKKGSCLLTRKPHDNAKEIKLAQLHKRDTFGEDSLLSGDPRNVNIYALSDISLLRLSKEKFISLIKEPSLKFISYSEIENGVANDTVLLDVRTPDKFKKGHLENSINAPFITLRMQHKTFNKKKKHIVICEDGNTSEAAAFLLLRNNFKAVILEGGLLKANKGLEQADEANQKPKTKPDADSEKAHFDPSSSSDSSTDGEFEESGHFRQINLLQKENQQLRTMVEQLISEKDELENKYRSLYKQAEKLKSILDSLKK